MPHSARVHNYWLGGKDNYEADRAAGDAVFEVYPGIVCFSASRLSARTSGCGWTSPRARSPTCRSPDATRAHRGSTSIRSVGHPRGALSPARRLLGSCRTP
ncbi:SAM-dependent methyltransferase [Pseudonocardia sp. DSM 110487]|uniref:SAM-dependent methyltransferase n=1 Tax=Pseudonocardia sp. DSM 110487 TaxID=2865833 RepID=UPI0021058CFD|nr:SAM-dependent methyltransferase [Pseudonocardia sp. DSM 110487]